LEVGRRVANQDELAALRSRFLSKEFFMSGSSSNLVFARTLVDRLDRHGVVVVRGVSNLVALRGALEHLVRAAGLTLAFDADSAPELRDYLFLASTSALQGAAVGSVLGLLLGVLVGHPKAFIGLGAAAGAAVGATEGVAKVESGWRLRATWGADGQPIVLVSAR